MTPRRQPRSLDAIAGDIHQLERSNIFAIGALLCEAEVVCAHGQWQQWLDQFAMSWSTADRYMRAAKLAAKFPTVKNLALTARTIYQLADVAAADLPDVIAALTAPASKAHLRARDADKIIAVTRARRRHGELPAATLEQLASVEGSAGYPEPLRNQLIAALKAKAPATDAAASALVEQTLNALARERKAAAQREADLALARRRDAERAGEDEAAALLAGPPPALPPAATSGAAPKFGAETTWPEHREFALAVAALRRLQAKPMTRLTGVIASADLRALADFLLRLAQQQQDKP